MDKPQNMTGQVAIITGGSKGIGYACAARLRDAGATVLICARNAEEVDAAAGELDAGTQRVAGLAADVGSSEDCELIVAHCIETFGRVDVLVNNAAVFVERDFLEVTSEHWDTTLDIDLRGPVLLSVAAARHMQDQGGGRIVHIASANALAAEPAYAAYSAAKAALVSLTQSMAVELAQHNILTNCVAPGETRTAITGTKLDELTPEQLAHYIPLGRAAETSEVAEVVAFLCDPAVTYILGETISVDGGMLAKQPIPF